MAGLTRSQADYYREFLMARTKIDPRDYGIDMEKDEFLDRMVEYFSDYTRGQISLDELLLRPRSALHFCDGVRERMTNFDLPDDIILRAIIQRRKNPNAD